MADEVLSQYTIVMIWDFEHRQVDHFRGRRSFLKSDNRLEVLEVLSIINLGSEYTPIDPDRFLAINLN